MILLGVYIGQWWLGSCLVIVLEYYEEFAEIYTPGIALAVFFRIVGVGGKSCPAHDP